MPTPGRDTPFQHPCTWAGRQRTKRPSEKLVLAALAFHADRSTGECFPSIGALHEWTLLDRKTIIAALNALAGPLELVEDTGRREGRTGQVKVYRLRLERVPESVPLPKAKGAVFGTVPPAKGAESGTVGPANGASFPIEESQKRDTEPTNEQPPKASPSPDARAGLPDGLPAGVTGEQWRGFVAMRRAIKKPLTPRAVELLVRQLATFAAEGVDPGAVVDQSTERSWAGLFPLKAAPLQSKTRPAEAGQDRHQEQASEHIRALQDREGEAAAAVRARLRLECGARTYDGWLKPTAFMVEDRTVTINCTSQFMVDWIRTHFAERLVLQFGERLGGPVDLSWQVVTLPAGGAAPAHERDAAPAGRRGRRVQPIGQLAARAAAGAR